MNFDLKAHKNLGNAVVRRCEKAPRHLYDTGDDSDIDSIFSTNKEENDVLQKELQKLDEEKKDKENGINGDKEVCANGHDIRLIDPSYNNYSMDYYKSLWGKITCVNLDCKNEGLTVGDLMKRNIMVHVCKKCEIYEGNAKCSYMMCNTCKVMEEDGSGRQRRSKRTRN